MKIFESKDYEIIKESSNLVVLAKRKYNSKFKDEIVLMPHCGYRLANGQTVEHGNKNVKLTKDDLISEFIELCSETCR